MTTIDIICELQEIARKIRFFEMRVYNYEQYNQYIELNKRQLELYELMKTQSALENNQTYSSQGISL